MDGAKMKYALKVWFLVGKVKRHYNILIEVHQNSEEPGHHVEFERSKATFYFYDEESFVFYT